MRYGDSLQAFPSSYLHVVVLLEELHAPLHHRGQVEVHHFVCGPVTRSQHLEGKARHGKARQGKARQGKARQGKARQGKARQGRHRILGRREGDIRATSGLAVTQCIYLNRRSKGEMLMSSISMCIQIPAR
jgi:hypothetical protein